MKFKPFPPWFNEMYNSIWNWVPHYNYVWVSVQTYQTKPRGNSAQLILNTCEFQFKPTKLSHLIDTDLQILNSCFVFGNDFFYGGWCCPQGQGKLLQWVWQQFGCMDLILTRFTKTMPTEMIRALSLFH